MIIIEGCEVSEVDHRAIHDVRYCAVATVGRVAISQ